jgi:long-chain acyl-CoA synthetase
MQAENQPGKVYMFAPEPNLKLTYAQLKHDSIELGKYLYKKGLQKGDKISFMLGNGYQTTKIFLGAMYSGFVVVPINLMAQPSQLEHVLNHSNTKLVFYTEDQKKKLEKATQKVDRNIILHQIDNDAENIFPVDESLGVPSLPEVVEEDDALLLYTSGSTGNPKGVILSHKNVVCGGQYTAMAHQLTPADRALCSLPLYHINGEVVTTIAPLISSGSVVMPHKFRTANFWPSSAAPGSAWCQP